MQSQFPGETKQNNLPPKCGQPIDTGMTGGYHDLKLQILQKVNAQKSSCKEIVLDVTIKVKHNFLTFSPNINYKDRCRTLKS
jgi:predicted aspartyl protease